jgi:hypothetical protein
MRDSEQAILKKVQETFVDVRFNPKALIAFVKAVYQEIISNHGVTSEVPMKPEWNFIKLQQDILMRVKSVLRKEKGYITKISVCIDQEDFNKANKILQQWVKMLWEQGFLDAEMEFLMATLEWESYFNKYKDNLSQNEERIRNIWISLLKQRIEMLLWIYAENEEKTAILLTYKLYSLSWKNQGQEFISLLLLFEEKGYARFLWFYLQSWIYFQLGIYYLWLWNEVMGMKYVSQINSDNNAYHELRSEIMAWIEERKKWLH